MSTFPGHALVAVVGTGGVGWWAIQFLKALYQDKVNVIGVDIKVNPHSKNIYCSTTGAIIKRSHVGLEEPPLPLNEVRWNSFKGGRINRSGCMCFSSYAFHCKVSLLKIALHFALSIDSFRL